ncbi:pilus assembly protein [Sphingomonas sp. DBB INV C78]|uniref:pilus assembly protein n=1 Tax=Sphingomonas sp. DBB INV C78 TaxID=3349434 RepID=UPI0036D29B88
MAQTAKSRDSGQDVKAAVGHKRSFLAKLRDDASGNVAVITAAAIIPLVCLIGSGVDISRAYAAQARMQVACDAASLAGRRAMLNGEVDQTVRDEVTKFFNFNFPQGSFQTKAFTPATSKGDKTSVVVTASTTIPTSIMKIFGFGSLPISATCNARQDFVNTDIILVLDTTGSMTNTVDDGDPAVADPTRIEALRSAVLALYDELRPVQTQLEAAGLRLRYSIVPYSSNVNVGKVVQAVNSSYIISDNADYQSRKPYYSKTETGLTQTTCTGRGGTPAPTWNKTSGSGVNPATGTCVSNSASSSYGSFGGWNYQQANFDVSSFVTATSSTQVATPSRHPTTGTEKSYWRGCIEERQTVSSIVASSGYTIPAAAYDLKIDMVPTSDRTTKWKPFWPEVNYLRNGTYQPTRSADSAYVACPTEAKRLQPWTRDDLNAYLNSLVAVGGTYHDIGMIWGARMLSRTGIFSADNPENFKNMPVSRFVIYMTDGAIAPNTDTYTAYGVETYDQRVTGSSSAPNQLERHKQRFLMACNATKGMNVSIWVIAFDSTLDDSLKTCASSSSQASTSANKKQLIDKFVEIGKNIGSLRLTQ